MSARRKCRAWLSRLGGLFGLQRTQQTFADEIESHL
jgi:hypothetical protein